MDRILAIDQENLVATVEPGVVTEQFQQAVEKVGLFYPPDPASLKFSTLGGNVAECAGGPRCVKYGVTKDYILGLEVVTPTGDIITTGGPTMKGVVGYDLTKLLCGSEGTLGIITKIVIKLLPLPEAKKTMLVLFDSIDGAARAVSAIVGAKIIPTTLEFMDGRTLDCVRQATGLQVPDAARAVLIIEVDGDREFLDKQAGKIAEIIQPLGVVETRIATTPAESEALWADPPGGFGLPAQGQSRQVQRGHLRAALQGAGDDPQGRRHQRKVRHPDRQLRPRRRRQHPRQRDDRQEGAGRDWKRPKRRSRRSSREHWQLGGTMSGEHGVGIAKAPYIPLEITPQTAAYMKTIKKALDPNNILNPGKIFLDLTRGMANSEYRIQNPSAEPAMLSGLTSSEF